MDTALRTQTLATIRRAVQHAQADLGLGISTGLFWQRGFPPNYEANGMVLVGCCPLAACQLLGVRSHLHLNLINPNHIDLDALAADLGVTSVYLTGFYQGFDGAARREIPALSSWPSDLYDGRQDGYVFYQEVFPSGTN